MVGPMLGVAHFHDLHPLAVGDSLRCCREHNHHKFGRRQCTHTRSALVNMFNAIVDTTPHHIDSMSHNSPVFYF
jgi:hypothetical protein